jgi:hypothetical protein
MVYPVRCMDRCTLAQFMRKELGVMVRYQVRRDYRWDALLSWLTLGRSWTCPIDR